MGEAPEQAAELRSLRLLRILVTVLLGVMIVGFIVLIALFVTRFTTSPDRPALPDVITLPEGTSATAFTQGIGWFAVVTVDDRILIFDAATGALRQSIQIQTTP